jgi:hypothetical protein
MLAPHGLAVIREQYQPSGINVAIEASLRDEFSRPHVCDDNP